MPCRVRVAGEGAVRASVCGRGGGGVCARDGCPALQPVGGTGHWAPREGCADRDTLPSEPRMQEGGRGRQRETISSLTFISP